MFNSWNLSMIQGDILLRILNPSVQKTFSLIK